MNVFNLLAKISLDSTEYTSGLQAARNIADKAATAMKVAFTAATTATIAFAKNAVSTGAAFDKSISQVAATMGKTTDEIGELRDFAQKMGWETVFSATQAADALNYMALAGYDAKTSMSMLPSVLNLAASGNMELARASDMVTDTQSALGLSIDETTALVDKMAAAASRSNTSVSQLGEAMLTVGGTAKILRGGTTELSTVLGILADNGIKGSEGGTALRNILLALTAPTDAAAKKLKELDVNVFDADGNMRDLQESFADLGDALSTLTKEGRQKALAEIFNNRDLKSAEALIATTTNRWNELTAAIDNAQGAAEKMSGTQLDNLTGDITLMQSAAEGAKIAFSDGLTPALREVVQMITKSLSKGSTRQTLNELGQSFGELVKRIAQASATAIPKLLSLFDDGAKKLKILTAATVAAVLAIKAAVNPIGALTSGLALLGTGLAVVALTAEETSKSFANLSAEERENLDNARALATAYDDIKSRRRDNLWEVDNEADKTRALWKELQTLADKNGVVAEGEEKRAQYILDELNNQLGTEYEMNGKMIKSYDDMGKAIDELIQKKRAARYLEAGEEAYDEAKKSLESTRTAITDAQNSLEIAKQEMRDFLPEIRQFKVPGTDEFNFTVWDKDLKEQYEQYKTAIKDAQAAVDELEKSEQNAIYEISRYENAYRAYTEGNTEAVIRAFEKETAARHQAAIESGKISKDELADIEKTAEVMADAYERYKANIATGLPGFTTEGLAGIGSEYEEARRQYEDALKVYTPEPSSSWISKAVRSPSEIIDKTPVIIEIDGERFGQFVFDSYNDVSRRRGEPIAE